MRMELDSFNEWNFFHPQMLSSSELLHPLIVELKSDQSIFIHERILRGGLGLILGEVDSYGIEKWLLSIDIELQLYISWFMPLFKFRAKNSLPESTFGQNQFS